MGILVTLVHFSVTGMVRVVITSLVSRLWGRLVCWQRSSYVGSRRSVSWCFWAVEDIDLLFDAR